MLDVLLSVLYAKFGGIESAFNCRQHGAGGARRERGGEEIEESKEGERIKRKKEEREYEKFEMGEREKREYFSVRST